MLTIITHVAVREGQEAAWDEALRERAEAARERPGFIAVQVTTPVDKPNERVIIGTWDSRENWQAWHGDDQFRETRQRLEVIDETTTDSSWHEVLIETHR
jgi:heme-degrading monooxygenase HmoA